MTYEAFLEAIQFHKTPKGARVDLALYVYPDGHGNIYNRAEGKWVMKGMEEVACPFNNPKEGLEILEDILDRGRSASKGEG